MFLRTYCADDAKVSIFHCVCDTEVYISRSGMEPYQHKITSPREPKYEDAHRGEVIAFLSDQSSYSQEMLDAVYQDMLDYDNSMHR